MQSLKNMKKSYSVIDRRTVGCVDYEQICPLFCCCFPGRPKKSVKRHSMVISSPLGVTMSTGSRGSGHFSQYSTASFGNSSSGNSQADSGSGGGGDVGGILGEDQNANVDPSAIYAANQGKTYRDRTQAWWTVGEYLDTGRGVGLTHQSAKFTLTGNRVFGNQKEEIWDLSDSLMELFEANQREHETATMQLHKRHKAGQEVDIQDWLSKDTTHGFIRVYAPDNSSFHISQLIPCTLSTSAHKICLMLGISLNALHVQMNGDIIRRLDPYEHPLVLQNEYLAGLGYSDICRIQEEGSKDELGYLIRFYAGKPFHDSTFSRNQLQAFIDIRKGKMLQQWVRRLCVISGTRLLIYKDKFKHTRPSLVQLAKGSVEEIKFKGHDLCLKLTSTLHGEKVMYLSFSEVQDYNKWYRKCKKATDKLPSSADLSNCHLEFLPETIFINDQLTMLNLRHNVLKERPIEEDIYTIGWIDDLPRFGCLRSLNLADNNLLTFPLALCFMKTLVELNIASNKLEEIPSEIQELTNLQALHLHNNHLSALPDELVSLRKLFILVLAFNRFTSVPPVVAQMTDVRTSEIENMIMAGNQISKLTPEILTKMKYVKKVDFRMNELTLSPSETMRFTSLEHLTHLDVRDNYVNDLDIRSVKSLEYLNCDRNDMESLQLNGQALKNLFAAHNKLEQLTISPKPEWLLQFDISHNQLRRLPEWLSDCFFLQRVNISHNRLTELPSRLFVDGKKLKYLRANHNCLESLPAEVDTLFIEELYVQHNYLAQLPNQLLAKANKLRVFNATKNKLTSLPPLNENKDLNKIQELFLTGNNLNGECFEVISGYERLKVLHVAHNEIHDIESSYMECLEMLQELNISGNQLRSLPKGLGTLSKLVVLRAHSNVLQNLPDFHKATSLRVLDVGHNRLLNVSVTSLMASQLNLLDMSLNAQLKVDPQEFHNVKNRKTVCLVDLTGQNRLLPGLGEQIKEPEVIEEETDPSLPWKAGFSETSGIRNKLCVATLKILKFGSENEAVFAMFDGGHNNEVPRILLEAVPNILKDELHHKKTAEKYIKYAILTAHRKLKTSGQRLGASSVLCHIRRMSSNQMNHYSLQMANVGDVEAVLCRRGEAMVLTHKHTTSVEKEECARIYKMDGIITEDNKVGGTTRNTRQLGCAYLYPHVIPDPFINTVTLRHDDEFIIIGNRGLWKFVSPAEAVEEIYEIGNPVVAAKKLQDLAQGYGSKENIAILVIRLNTDSRPSLAKLRPRNRSMSIDDFEAAAQLQGKKPTPGPPQVRASTGELAEKSEIVVQMELETTQSSSAVPHISTSRTSVEPKSAITEAANASEHLEVTEPYKSDSLSSSSTIVDTVHETAVPERVSQSMTIDTISPKDKKSPFFDSRSVSSSPPRSPASKHSPHNSPLLKPLPKQRFLKKNAASEWEAVLQRRLTDDVKDKEMKASVRALMDSQDSMLSETSRQLSVVEIEADSKARDPPVATSVVDVGNAPPPEPNWTGSLGRKRGTALSAAINPQSGGLRMRTITPPWVKSTSESRSANPAYSLNKEVDEKDVINLTSRDRRQPKVRKTIAMFENLQKENMDAVAVKRKSLAVAVQGEKTEPEVNTSPRAVGNRKVVIVNGSGGDSNSVESSSQNGLTNHVQSALASLDFSSDEEEEETGFNKTSSRTTVIEVDVHKAPSHGSRQRLAKVEKSAFSDGPQPNEDDNVTVIEIARL